MTRIQPDGRVTHNLIVESISTSQPLLAQVLDYKEFLFGIRNVINPFIWFIMLFKRPTIIPNKFNIKQQNQYNGWESASILFVGNLLTPSPAIISLIPVKALVSSRLFGWYLPIYCFYRIYFFPPKRIKIFNIIKFIG